MQEETSKVMGAVDSQRTLRTVLASRKPCKVLDAASGEGSLAEYLHNLGWDVHCADIRPELLKRKSLPNQKINLNRRLPYKDEEFEAVVCANAMHRLFNPGGAAREFYRILRPNGQLYLNVNNFASIEARVQFLLFGSIEVRRYEAGLTPVGNPEADVRVRIMYPQLAQYLEAAGFKIISVKAAPPWLGRRWLAPLCFLVWLVSRFLRSAKREKYYIHMTNSRAILFGGHYMVVEAVKQ